MTYRKTMLSTSILGVLMLSGAAFAADQPAVPAAQDGTQAQSAPAAAADETRTKPGKTTELQTITVSGVIGSEMRAIQLKRYASNVQDSISAENIGELPDLTISDSLQRVTGVQITRSAGEGAGVAVRGLSQVQTQLNGESFLPASNIVTTQPDYSAIPASLFNGVDVIKTPTASLINSGLSGTINLRTQRPWDMKSGWTFNGAVAGTRGSDVGKTEPKANALISFNDDGKWGFLLAVDQSDITHQNSAFRADQYAGPFLDETTGSSGAGFYGYATTTFANNGAPLPSEFNPRADGSVDLNGDGKYDGAFASTHMYSAEQNYLRRKRTGVNASFQGALTDALTLTADGFYTRLNENNRQVVAEIMPSGWMQQASFYTDTTPTGNFITNSVGGQSEVYSVQGARYWPGDIASATNNTAVSSKSRNLNVQLDFNDGGFFTGSLRAINAKADATQYSTSLEMVQSNGNPWTGGTGEFMTPDGMQTFNPGGYPAYTSPIDMNYSGFPTVSLSPEWQKRLSDPKSNVYKGFNGLGGYTRDSGMNIQRFDGALHFDNGNSLDFGVRNSIRTAQNTQFFLASKVYGCDVMYHAFDIQLDGATCDGPYRASGEYSGLTYDQLPAAIKNNWKYYSNLAGTGMGLWAMDPKAMDNPRGLMTSMYPDTFLNVNPGGSWDTKLHETALYLQGNFVGDFGPVPYEANVGGRYVRTNLHVTQNVTGDPQPYGLYAAGAGQVYTNRSYNDFLPAANIALHFTPDFVLRGAWSKNMVPLNLDQWGGGVTFNYALNNTTGVQEVASGSEAGNPMLDPWRSTNADLSLEYYLSDKSMVNLAYFQIRVDSFIRSTNILRSDVPNKDGSVTQTITYGTQEQGKGTTLHGWEFNWRQALSDWNAPGFLANTGFSANWTYAPSSTGEVDLAKNPVPFANNSEYSGNLVLWYQGDRVQVRVAGNYRSKQATVSNYGGIPGLQQYLDSQTFLDASVSYKLNDNVRFFLQGSNLTGEEQRYYLTWKDQYAHSTKFEKRYEAGVNVTF
jgi:TonB-dependent receptor